MTYVKQTWQDNNPSYPVSAARLGHIEDGLDAVANGGSRSYIGAPSGDTTGATDSATIAAAITAMSVNGGEVVFSAGTYYVSSAITLPSTKNGRLLGCGPDATIIKLANGSTASTNVIEVNGQFWDIQGLAIDGNRTNNASGGDGIKVTFPRTFISHVYIHDTHGHAIHMVGTIGQTAHANYVHDVYILNCDGTGIFYDGQYAMDQQLTDIWIGSCAIGIRSQATTTIATNVHVWGCTGDGIVCDGTVGGYGTWMGLYIETCGGIGFHIIGSGGVQEPGHVVNGGIIRTNIGGGIIVNAADRQKFVGLTVKDNTGPGASVVASQKVQFQACNFYDFQTPKTQTYAVTSSSASDYTVIVGCSIDATDHLTGSTSLVGTHNDLGLNPGGSLLATTEQIQVSAAGAGSFAASVFVSGEAQKRWIINGDGTMNWGPGGSTTQDTTLSRDAAAVLKGNGAFALAGLTGATGASRYVGATASGAPASGTFAIGDFVIDRTGTVWICVTAGTPGTWTNAAKSAMQLYHDAIGVLTQNFDPATITANTAPVSQTVYGQLFGVKAGQVINGIMLRNSTAANGTAPTTVRAGIASKAGVMLAISGNLNAAANFPAGAVPLALSGAYTVLADGAIFGCFVVNGTWSVTQPTPGRGGATATNETAYSSNAPPNFSWTAQTDLPAVSASLTLTAGSSIQYQMALY